MRLNCDLWIVYLSNDHLKMKIWCNSFDVATVLCAFNCSSEWEKGNPPLIEYGDNLNILIISFFVSFLFENKACHSFYILFEMQMSKIHLRVSWFRYILWCVVVNRMIWVISWKFDILPIFYFLKLYSWQINEKPVKWFLNYKYSFSHHFLSHLRLA